MKRRESIYPKLKRIAFATTVAVAACISTSTANESQITIIAEWIELELADLHQLTAGEDRLPLRGDELRKAVTDLIDKSRAEVIHISIVNSRSGQRAKTKGIDEVSYPTAFSPPKANANGEGIINAMPINFETRQTGPSLEVDPVLSPDGKNVNLQFAAEIIKHLGERSYGKDEAESEVPDFHTMRIVTQLTVESGRYRLAGTFRPHAQMGEQKRKDPRLMLFLRANVTPVIPPANTATTKGTTIQNPAPKSTLAFHFEFIETEMALMNELLIDKRLSTRGPQLRDALIDAIGTGRATLIESVVAAEGAFEKKVVINSGLELIYPTEWDPAEISDDGSHVLPTTPAAFETIQLGSVISFTSEFGGGDIQLNLLSEMNTYVSEQKYMRDESEVSFPLNHFAKLSNQISLWPGEVALAGTVRPDQPAVEGRKDPVIAIFVRGDAIDSSVLPKPGKEEAQ